MFGQWTLKNMLNIDDAYTRISTIVPDTYLDTYPEFLIEQWFEREREYLFASQYNTNVQK